MECKLHDYQEYSKNWVLEHPYSALLLDMGLGKTLSSLTAIDELISTFGLNEKILVIAPLSVAQNTWDAEIKKWDHLNHLTYTKVLGSKQEREQALAEDVDIYLINRENVVWLVDYYKKRWPFKTVIIDELSSFKDPKSKRFKALRKVRPLMDRVVGLTGTPAPNTLIDLWPQIYLLDQGERLGKTITSFRNRYFRPAQQNGHIVYSWEILPGAEKEIYDKISDICVSMKAKDHLNLPERINNNVVVNLTATERQKYKTLERDYVLSLTESDVVAANAAVLSNKLLQMANGCIYDENQQPQIVHDAKLEALERIVEEAQGQPVLVFYSYKHDLERIQKRFKQATSLDIKSDHIGKWNQGKIELLLAHPQSAGHGLNLQKGGHIIVWFGLTWSLEYYQQANARLDRQGQTESVIVHHIVTKDTLDEQVLQTLERKEVNQDALLEAVKARIESIRKGEYL